MAGIEVIPVHLIYSHRKGFLQLGVDSFLDDAVVDELVDVEGGRVPVVKNERMPQRFRPQIVGLFCLEKLE